MAINLCTVHTILSVYVDILNRYAANIGPRILEYFEGFLGVDYPLSKEDMAAVPDFGPGAMENWGHMNFRFHFISPFTPLPLSRL